MYVRTYFSPEFNVTLPYDISDAWNVSMGMRFVGWKKHVERHTDMSGYSNDFDNKFTNRGNIMMFGVRYKYQGRTNLSVSKRNYRMQTRDSE